MSDNCFAQCTSCTYPAGIPHALFRAIMGSISALGGPSEGLAKAALEAMGLGKDLSGSTFQAQDEGINSRKLAHEPCGKSRDGPGVGPGVPYAAGGQNQCA
jgi:hypothetical protein